MEKLRVLSLFMMTLVVFGSFAPFAAAQQFRGSTSSGFAGGNYGSVTNTYQSSRPTFDNFYRGSFDTYWPILNNLKEDQCDAVNSDFIVGIPPGGCSPMVVRSDLLAEQNVPVFCQLSAIRVNPLIDVSTIKQISFKGDYLDEVAGISFHPARAATKSYRTLIGDPIEENIGYVVIVLKQQPDERNLEEEISGLLSATIRYDAKGAFGTGAAEYYLEPVSDDEWGKGGVAAKSSFWSGKGYLRATNVDDDSATVEVLTGKDDVYRTVTLKEGETSSRIYYPGQYCTAAMKLKLNKIDNSEDMAKINIDGDTFWVRKGSKLLGGKCVVRDLNVFPGGSGTVEISCSGNSKFILFVGDGGVVLDNGTAIEVGIGGSIKGNDKDYYLGYYGQLDILKSSDDPSGRFVILFDDKISESEVSDLTALIDVGDFKDEADFKSVLLNNKIFKKEYLPILLMEGSKDSGIEFVPASMTTESDKYGADSYIPKYMNLSEHTVLELVDNFPSGGEDNKYWGEEALSKQIDLAGEIEDEDMRIELIDKFLEEYPGSDSTEYMRDLKLELGRFDYAGSSKNVFVNNADYNIRAEGFASGSGANDSVNVQFGGGASYTLKRDRVYNVSDKLKEITDVKALSSYTPRLTVNDIDGESAKLTYYWKDEKGKTKNVVLDIDVGQYGNANGIQVSVIDTKIREVAYVSLIPEVRNTKTEANFTFNIGVEKRAVELSPEKANKKIKRLNESIAKWEERIEKLGNVVKGMRGACFATSTVLTLKSVFSGFAGGKSIARAAVMDVYEEKCKTENASMDLHECYSVRSKEIEAAVDSYGAAVTAVNSKVQACTANSKGVKSDFLDSKVVDSKVYVDDLRSCVGLSGTVYTTKDGVAVTTEHLNDASDWRAVLLKQEACKAGLTSDACVIATKEMEKVLSDNVDRINVKSRATKIGVSVDDIYVDSRGIQSVHVSKAASDLTIDGFTIKKDSYYKIISSGNHEYVYELKKRGTGSFEVVNVYDSGVLVTDSVALKNRYNFVETAASDAYCSNTMLKPYVRYYESGNKQGFAAIVPVDKRAGWYAHVEHGDYTESGVANDFWLCNVGTDGLIGDGVKGGDKCQLFQSSSAGEVSDFVPCPKMSAGEVKRLYQKASTMIRNANKNTNGVDLDGDFIHKTTPLGPESTGLECTDFMSPQECNLMFNVCDPVICPTSRCDLGGTFPVSDVVASGIVGSVALCLPNFGDPTKGGVVVPVCLSGLHAGLDSYVSILKSHRQCLEENVKSGRYTGICDEISAVYTCEFFWGQISPILDTLLVRFVEGLYGGFQTKGGAEYLTIQKAFDNLDKSVDYFANSYMKNSLRAFNMKNTEEIGSTVCKGFVGSSVPTSADVIDSLLEPESPSQFYAYFSEDVFSEATVPSTSHYKVYYHIYAGNERGAQYRVYLKSPPESSYYASRQTLLVDSGFAQKGVASDEAIDFTAPTGYKELCVSVNGVDECGFGSVTSEFGLNYASQAYVADQADDRQIDSTADCVATSTSAWAMAGPNLQAGAEKALGQDDIASTGIVRICASDNPDEGVVGGNDVYCKPSEKIVNNTRCGSGYLCIAVPGDVDSDVGICRHATTNDSQISQGKWIDVGTCDNENVRCWLDSTTVEKNLDQYMAVNDITSIDELVRDSEDLRELDEQYGSVKEKLNVLKESIDELKGALIDGAGELMPEVESIIVGLNEVAGVGKEIGQGSNAAKAEALAIKAGLYRLIVKKELEKRENVDAEIIGGKLPAVAATTPAVTELEPTTPEIVPVVWNNIKEDNVIKKGEDVFTVFVRKERDNDLLLRIGKERENTEIIQVSPDGLLSDDGYILVDE